MRTIEASRPMDDMATPPLALLADSDADTRTMYAEFLRPAYEIDEAADGREALAKAISHCPDVVITEIQLPGISGFELCEVLRSDRLTRSVPILFVTGDVHARDVTRAQRAGADSVLVKPCLPDTLLLEIRRLLALSGPLREQARVVREQARAVSEAARSRIERSEQLIAMSLVRQPARVRLNKAFERRDTTEPSLRPPRLFCPECETPLHYQHSHIGGVSAKSPEQWDYYECLAGCGVFQYRHRTRKVRKMS